MSLQRRLTLFFVLIVILPLAAAGFIVQRVIAGEVNERAVLSIRPALDATAGIYNDQSESLERRVRSALDDRQTLAFAIKKGNTELLREYLQERVMRNEGLDLLVARAPGMAPVFVAEDPLFLEGVVRPTVEQVLNEPDSVGVARTPALP